MTQADITTEDLKRIAEACGLTIAPTSHKNIAEVWDDTGGGFFGTIGPKHGDGYSLFAPHLDANHAIACLDRRFLSYDHLKQPGLDGKPVHGIRAWLLVDGTPSSSIAIQWQPTFPLAATSVLVANLYGTLFADES